jgi:mannose-1-phosphate guanylyltransferase
LTDPRQVGDNSQDLIKGETTLRILILAGGLGTRLRTAISDRPKAMAEAGDRPFLEHLVEQLRDQGFDEFVLCAGYMAEQIGEHFGDGRRWSVSVQHSVETERLGTAGAIKHAQPLIDGPFIAMNGDSFIDADFQGLVAAHQAHRVSDPRTIGTILSTFIEDATAYGTLALDGAGRVLRFREKASSTSGWINGGVYVLEPEILELIPAQQKTSIERETFPAALAEGWHLFGHPTEGFFVDIGTPAGYRRFRQYVEEKRQKPLMDTDEHR